MNYSFTVPGLLVLVIIMGYYFFRPQLPIRQNRAFLAILVIDICTVMFDYTANRLNETWPVHPPALLWGTYLLYYVFYLTRIYMFFVFTISVLDARGNIRSSLSIYSPIVYFPAAALVLSSPLTGWVFTIREGFRPGPLYDLLYFTAGSYLLFSLIAIFRSRRRLTTNELIGLVALQAVLLAGNVVRVFVTNFLVMNTFCLMAIMVIFLSFQNPDLYLSDRGYVYNLPAFRALLLEWHRKRRHWQMVAFVQRNYNEHREIFGGQQTDEALIQINRYLRDSFPEQCCFYLRNGSYAIAGPGNMDADAVCEKLSARFREPWKTSAGDLLMEIVFLRTDTELHTFPVDRLINTLLITLDEAGTVPGNPGGIRGFPGSDSSGADGTVHDRLFPDAGPDQRPAQGGVRIRPGRLRQRVFQPDEGAAVPLQQHQDRHGSGAELLPGPGSAAAGPAAGLPEDELQHYGGGDRDGGNGRGYAGNRLRFPPGILFLPASSHG